MVFAGNYREFVFVRREILQASKYNVARIRYLSYARQILGLEAKILFYGTYQERKDFGEMSKMIRAEQVFNACYYDDFKEAP